MTYGFETMLEYRTNNATLLFRGLDMAWPMSQHCHDSAKIRDR